MRGRDRVQGIAPPASASPIQGLLACRPALGCARDRAQHFAPRAHHAPRARRRLLGCLYGPRQCVAPVCSERRVARSARLSRCGNWLEQLARATGSSNWHVRSVDFNRERGRARQRVLIGEAYGLELALKRPQQSLAFEQASRSAAACQVTWLTWDREPKRSAGATRAGSYSFQTHSLLRGIWYGRGIIDKVTPRAPRTVNGKENYRKAESNPGVREKVKSNPV